VTREGEKTTWRSTISPGHSAGVRPARAVFALVPKPKESTEMSVVENAKEQVLSSGSWSVDPAHSTIEFRVKHMMIQTVRGRFRDYDGTIVAGYPEIGFHARRLVWNRVLETGNLLVSDAVDLVLDVPAVRVD
jgi:hypothetical protein